MGGDSAGVAGRLCHGKERGKKKVLMAKTTSKKKWREEKKS